MDSKLSTGMRAGRVGAVMIMLLTLAGPAMAPRALAQDPSPSEPTRTEWVRGWPGTRIEPAGLYSFDVTPGARAWMHKVPDTWTESAPDSVELAFRVEPPFDGPATMGIWSFDSGPAAGRTRLVMWLLEVGDLRVLIDLSAFPDTDPALIAEAEAVIASITVEQTNSDGRRVVFRLPAGWDSG